MKLFISASVLLLSLAAQASSTVCAGPSIYYNETRTDSGIRPSSLTGRKIIVNNGKVLFNKTYEANLGQFEVEPYSLFFSGPEKILERTGSQVGGAKIVKQQVILNKVDAINGSRTQIVTEEVICKKTWAMVP